MTEFILKSESCVFSITDACNVEKMYRTYFKHSLSSHTAHVASQRRCCDECGSRNRMDESSHRVCECIDQAAKTYEYV